MSKFSRQQRKSRYFVILAIDQCFGSTCNERYAVGVGFNFEGLFMSFSFVVINGCKSRPFETKMTYCKALYESYVLAKGLRNIRSYLIPGGKMLSCLLYADDIALFNSKNRIDQLLDHCEKHSQLKG